MCNYNSLILVFSLAILSCHQAPPKDKLKNNSFEQEIQEKLINATEGDTISLPEGFFSLKRSLTLSGVKDVTIKGAGMDKTILSFANQLSGAEGLKITADGVAITDLAIEDTKGDAIKVQDSKGVTFKNLRVRWSSGPNSENGAYGLYPVSCQEVLVEGCMVSDASDAGIYVGQSTDVIVRNNKAFHNVAGIEIENCIRADVYDNESYENTGGLFVFDLPELPQKNGHTIKLHNNKIWDNNLENFAPAGNTVALVPAGTGVLIMSTRNVEIYQNEIKNHRTTSTCIVSYLITQNPFEDSLYNPFSYGIYIHDNTYEQKPSLPDTSKAMGKLVAGLFGAESPEIIYDGTMDPKMIQEDGTLNEKARICIKDNGDINFANINAPSGFAKIDTNISGYDCTLNIE